MMANLPRESKDTATEERSEDQREVIPFGLYVQERQAGLSNEQIAEKHNLFGDDLMRYAEEYTNLRKEGSANSNREEKGAKWS